jgi:hypothetical protein
MKDISILRMVAGGLILALLIILAGCFWMLISTDKAVPNEFWAIGFSIVTGLLGLLAPSRTAAAGE